MGHKVNPLGFRLNLYDKYISNWFSSSKNYLNYLKEDFYIREFINKKLSSKFIISQIYIEKSTLNLHSYLYITIELYFYTIFTKNITSFLNLILKNSLTSLLLTFYTNDIKFFVKNKYNENSIINFNLLTTPHLNAKLFSQSFGTFLLQSNKLSTKSMLYNIITQIKQISIKGLKVKISGILDGEEKAKSVSCSFGKLPLNSYKSNLDYAFFPLKTKFGIRGIKVWLYK